MELHAISPHLILNLYHFCVVVDDFDAALGEIGGQLGIESWTRPVYSVRAFRTANGSLVSTPVRASFSVEGPPHLEIIEAHDEPHTLWPRGAGPRLDHIGVHAQDAAAEVERLLRRGLTLEAEFVDLHVGGAPTPRQVYYLRDPRGMRIEVVDVSRREHLRRWLAGEAYPAA